MDDKTPSKILYHYTTQEGLLGIIKEKALWATKIQFLNDASELVTPLEIACTVLQDALEKKRSKSTTEWTEDPAQILRNFMRGSTNVNIFVASFCEDDGDRLSQ